MKCESGLRYVEKIRFIAVTMQLQSELWPRSLTAEFMIII